MSIKAKIEAIIYAAEDPVTFEQIFALIKEEARLELAHLRRQKEAEDETEAGVVSEQDVMEPVQEELNGAEAAVADATAPPENTATEDDPSEAPNTETAEAEAPAAEDTSAESGSEQKPELHPISDLEVKSFLRASIEELMSDCGAPERGIEVRQVAGGYRMATKPEQHDVVRSFAKSLKPPIRLSLQALETLAVIAYKQPITAPEISEVRGVDSGGVLGTLLDRKLITTAGRKQVIGRPILYKTTKEFLLRFGLKDVNELPSMEEFEKLAAESLGSDLFTGTQASGDGTQESSAPASEESAAAQGEAGATTPEQTAEPAAAEAPAPEDAPVAEAAAAAEEPGSGHETEGVAESASAENRASAEEPPSEEQPAPAQESAVAERAIAQDESAI